MEKILPLLFIITILTFSQSSQNIKCPQNNLQDLIQTDIIVFQNTNQRQSCKELEVKFSPTSSKLQAVASVISTQNYHVSNGVDYTLKVGYNKKNNNKFTITLLSDYSSKWVKITVSYVATSRTDLILGSFLTDTFQTLRCIQNAESQSNIVQATTFVNSWNQNFLNAKPIVFLSGIKTLNSDISLLQILSVQLNSTGVLKVKIQSSHGLQLEYIQLSYILVSSEFPFQHGYQLNHPQYQFSVFQQFNSNKLVQVKWGIYTGSLICEGKSCVKQCVSKDECTKSIGYGYNGHCYFCEKGTAWDGQKCINLCNQNQVWNGEQCVCQTNSIRSNSLCKVCPVNSSPDKNQQQCVCNNGFIWNNWKSLCVAFSCPVNSQPKVFQTGVQCVCKSGFYKLNDVCKLVPECPLNSVFDLLSKKCICSIQGQFMSNGVCITCNKNQIFDDIVKKCVCKQNNILSNGNCLPCPSYSTVNADKSKCICNQGYIWSQWKTTCLSYKCPINSLPIVLQSEVKCKCKEGFYLNGQVCQIIPKCPVGSYFDNQKKKCICEKKNYNLINGQCLQCSINSAWNGNQCLCNQGYTNLNGQCILACGKNEILDNGRCICNLKSIFWNSICQECPLNSLPNKQKTVCNCIQGYKWQQVGKCCNKVTCPQNSFSQTIESKTVCVCKQGFTMQNGLCLKVSRCPLNSLWSEQKQCCQCANSGEYMISNECRKCKANSQWNDKQKVCKCKNGYNLINDECKLCEINEVFNGKTCQCNLGFYRNGGTCSPCYSSCGTCLGPSNNQCLTCADVTYNLKNGSCVKDTLCPKGLFQKGSSCSPCSTYCSDCKSESVCNTCIDGFQMESVVYGGVTATYCVEKCGDGKRFQLDCDDGNNKNGDGCSSDCKIQAGWTCSGGSSTQPSACTQGTPQRTFLELTGTVHLYGKIVQGIKLSYIPQSLTANDCAQCYNLLWIRVIRSDIIPGVRVNYLPKSQYQFLAQFDFQGTFSIPTFNIAVQINPQYSKYFSRRDMAQIQIKTIDPAVLAMKDNEQQLSIGDITTNKSQIQVSKSLVQLIFK